MTTKTKGTAFSIARVEKSKEFVAAEGSVADIVSKAKRVEIANESQREITTAHLEGIAKALKKMEGLRKQFVKPIKDSAKAIDQFFKERTAPMKEAEQVLRSKLGEYLDRIEAEAAAANAKAQEDHAAATEEIEALGGAPVAAPAVIAAPVKKVGSTTTRKVLHIEVEDLRKVPITYLVLDESAVKSAYKAGTKTIPGLILTEKNALTVR